MSCCTINKSIDILPISPIQKSPTLSLWRLVLSFVLSGNMLVLSLVINISDTSELALPWLHGIGFALCIIVAGLVGNPLWQSLKEAYFVKRLGIEVLFLSGIVAAALYSLHSMLHQQNTVYFEIVSLLLSVYALGKTIKQTSQHRVLQALQDAAPSLQTCIRQNAQGDLTRTAVADINIGDCVHVAVNSIIPIDGIIIKGEASINEAALTGEGCCVIKSTGDHVLAGSHNLDGQLHIQASSPGSQRKIDAMGKLLLQGLAKKSSIEQQVDTLARWFFPIVATVAAATCGYWYMHAGFHAAFLNSMAVLLVACPCALGFATPVGMWAAATVLARLGLYTRNTAAIERLASIDTVVFDKTGTLTFIEPQITQIVFAPTYLNSKTHIMAMIAAAQRLSNHPVAQAFGQLGMERDKVNHYIAQRLELLPACGIRVWLKTSTDQTSIVLGNPSKLNLGVNYTTLAAQLLPHSSSQRQIAILVNDTLVALASLTENTLPQTPITIAALQRQNIRVQVLSGDTPNHVASYAKFGIAAHAGLQATDKAARVQALAKLKHHICYVGDGINDAAAMAYSSVSIAQTHGSPLTVESADFVLEGQNLQVIPQALQVARHSMQVVRSNLHMALFYNVIAMIVAASGYLQPVFAACIMMLSSLTVTLRSVILLQQKTS